MSTWTQLVWVLGDDLIQTGWRFRLDSEDKKGRPCQADHCYSKPWFPHSHLPASGMRAFFILTFVCSSDIHWTPSEILLRALGHVLGPQGYRTHSECLFWVTHHAKCFIRALALNPHSIFPLLLFFVLWPCLILCVNCASSALRGYRTGNNAKAMGRLLLVEIPASSH